MLFGITFTVFIFTNDAHRYSIDEDIPQQLAIHILTGKPDPQFVQGQSKMEFNYESLRPWLGGPPCQNGILCYPADIGYAVTEIPFIFANHYLHVIDKNTVIWSVSDFDDPYYISFRNSIDPDFTFLELFYGPVLSALSVGVFFLVCRTFDFNAKNSVILAIFYGLTTTLWAYSKTSVNAVPVTLFVLIGFLLFRKFQKTQSSKSLMISSTSLGFAFLVRQDAILFIMPLFLFLLYNLRKKNKKLEKIFSFSVPLISSYLIYKVIGFIRFGYESSGISSVVSDTSSIIALPYPMSIFGLLLSPGVGLFIFAPILLISFLTFRDFYNRNKSECLLFIMFIALFLITYGSDQISWHGLVAWGARYLVPIVPFLLLPLGSSLEKRNNKILKTSLFILGITGVFFNIVYVIQDVSWFVWSRPGSTHGLYSIAKGSDPIYISPATLWSFEYSQLTQSVITAFTHLQPDIFLLKLLGPIFYALSLTTILISLSYVLIRKLKQKRDPIDFV